MKKEFAVNHNVVFWIALGLMFILRLPLSWIEDSNPSMMVWTVPVYEVGTYLLIIFLIWWERENLEIHHMDAFAIFMIILFKPISTIILRVWNPNHSIAFPRPLSIVFFAVAIVVLVLILRKQIKLKIELGKSFLWMITGGVLGILYIVALSIILVRYFNFPVNRVHDPSMWISPVYQLGFAAAAEEPFFRGFLWGGLLKAGVKNIWILFIQAILFAAGHLNLLNTANPGLNLFLVFLGALVMGILVWRSKKLSSSMMFHAFHNGSSILQYWAQLLIFK